MQIIKYARDVGTKFNENGNIKTFTGNTVICNVNPKSKTYKVLCTTKEMLANMIDKYKYTFLPESSYHMTVIEGVCNAIRKKEYWTNLLPLDTNLEVLDDFFEKQYKDIEIPESFSMNYNGFEIGDVIIVKLVPNSNKDFIKIKKFRDAVSKKFGLRFPNHNNYLFHITLAYNIIKEDKDNKKKIDYIRQRVHNYLKDNFGIFKTSSPELMFFNNMFEFTKSRGIQK